jgi:hypothetical protein
MGAGGEGVVNGQQTDPTNKKKKKKKKKSRKRKGRQGQKRALRKK